jgi:hypothetical protein
MMNASDFFDSQFGNYYDLPAWRSRRFGAAADFIFDRNLQWMRANRALSAEAARHPKRKILIAGVDVPSRTHDLKNLMLALSRSRHEVVTMPAPLRDGLGKFQNINACLKNVRVEDYDWLIVIDDDIALPKLFLDRFICMAERANLSVCQPAHRFRSHQSYEITQRRWNSLARVTHFVESGPFTAFHRRMFACLLPFPDLRWAWGTDVLWSEMARRENLLAGIVDATPIEHLRPVAGSYNGRLAREEGTIFLQEAGVNRSRREILQTVQVISNI